MEDSMNFIEIFTQIISKYPNISGILADLLNNIRKDCETETEFVYPKLRECLKFIIERFNSYHVYNFKLSEEQMKLLCAALCLSGKEDFLIRFDELVGIILSRIREKFYSNDALLILNELLETYYNRYPDAWATLLDRTESIFNQIFPDGRKNVLGCDDDVKRIVKVLETVTKKLPRYCYNEIIKKLVRQCNQIQNHDNFPWDRANIALQTFLYLCSNHSSNSGKAFVWKVEFSNVKIGDLELEPMSKEVSDLIKTNIMKICKQYWQSSSNEFIFDSNKTRLLKFLVMVLEKYTLLVDEDIVLKLMESNVPDIREKAKEVYLRDEHEGDEEIIHKIGNMIFGQSFKLPTTRKYEENNMKVYSFFEESFNWDNKVIPTPPEGFQENRVLRGGVFYILESLSAWKSIDPQSSGKLDIKEIELFGRVVDVYFRLLTRYESLVKTVYLEKQDDKNIILRSWSSLVGFKRNSKEIIDFLVSILGYSDERLKMRIIESYKYLPMSKLSEFMKLFERYRLAVSEDFVNLKRSRRNDKAKLEITRVYKNVLISWKSQEITNLTPLRMILRHVIELYYYVSKNEIVDEFIWSLRGEFCGLLKEYLAIIIIKFNINTKKSFLPLKFHLEVWLTVDEWQNQADFDNLEDIEGLFVNFSFNLISAVKEVDQCSLPGFIDNLIIKISRLSTNEDFKIGCVYNLLKSCDKTSAQLVFDKMVEWIGSGKDNKGKNIQEGIKKVLKETGEEESENFIGGPTMKLFKLMCDDLEEACDPESVLEVFNLVTDSKLQRKILNKLKFKEGQKSEKLIKSLFELSQRLMETFPNTLNGLWRSAVGEDKNNMSSIVHFLVDRLQKDGDGDNYDDLLDAVIFVYKAIEEIDKESTIEMLLRYAHPFVGTRKIYNITPLDAVLKVLERISDDGVCDGSITALHVLFLHDKNDIDNSTTVVNSGELMKWALECPVNKISSLAWKELKKQVNSLSPEFIKELLKGTRRFLQHLVCPATLKYFDPTLVEEILDFYDQVVINNNCTSEVLELIYEFALVQLSSEDEIIFISSCKLIKNCLKRRNNEKTISIRLYRELVKKPALSIDLMHELMIIDFSLTIEKYFCNLISFLPFIFRLFEEFLNIKLSDDNSKRNFDYLAEFEYLKLLIKQNQRIIIEEANVDENGNLCLLELGEFLISIEKQKKRTEIDFYKTIASILADLNIFTLNFISEIDEEKFLIYYFDVLRLKSVNVPEDLAYKIANKLACSNDNDDSLVKQRVIDFLIKF